MNLEFNTIETIANSNISNKSAAYLAACNVFEEEASEYLNNESIVSRKSAEEVSSNYAKAQSADCEYSVYRACLAAEKWLEKAWNNAE